MKIRFYQKKIHDYTIKKKNKPEHRAWIKCINKKNNKKKLTFKFKNIKYIKKKDKVQ